MVKVPIADTGRGESGHYMANKFNPFRPNKIVGPGAFAGRAAELRAIDRCLLQTKHNNSEHFIIEGERGIGKSSLLFCAQCVALGKVSLMGSNDRLGFLVVNITLEPKDDALAIYKKLGASLRGASLEFEPLKKIGLGLWDFVTSFEAAGIKYKKPSEGELIDFATTFSADLIKILQTAGESLDGIVIFIDEADNATGENGLGAICKLVTEKLSFKNVNRVCFGLAGLPAVVSGLRDSHESSPRLFEILSLKPLEAIEREQVVRQAIGDANEKRTDRKMTTIEDAAVRMLCNLSEGYPHFLQEFGYHAFEQDDDDRIDINDISACLFNEHGVFDQLGRKYFARYYDMPVSNDYRKVLDVMAPHFDEWVERRHIVQETGLREGTVDNALRALKAKQIIIQDESRKGKGLYRLPTRSFAIWIKAKRPPAFLSIS